jgi:phosphoribosyl-ATP pyrophosphohydrolase/phosphoribosyl-AMP cyclohydrolase
MSNALSSQSSGPNSAPSSNQSVGEESISVDFNKYPDQLVPAIVQDDTTLRVLMMGFMNPAALEKTISTGKVTFFSRSKNRIWTKGEESGNFLLLKSWRVDCDRDTILVKAHPVGPVCHTGSDTCWDEVNPAPVEETSSSLQFLSRLEQIIEERRSLSPEDSYIAKLFSKGINKVAQKVGEEAVEVVIEAKDDNIELFLEESADLLFHYLMLLQAKGMRLEQVVNILKNRHEQKQK